jgi:hypothetical protein
VKKLWLVVALVALGGLTSRTYADVQNIRLSGDIRIRGYFLDSAGLTDVGSIASQGGDASFISQRTRVSVEADLEDHVLVVVTLQAEGTWGSGNQNASNSGAGSARAGGAINRRWDLGVSEAYVQLNEVFYTPATLKVGRQFLNYGHGLILSSEEQEYNYDAARLVLDYYPLTIDLVGAELVNNQAFQASPSYLNGADLLFANARYEMTDSVIKNVEGYVGWVSQATSGTALNSGNTRVPPTIAGASPWIIGARTDLQPLDGLQVWGEGTYEGGASGTPTGKNISAGLLNLGARFTLKDTQWSPAVNANYIYATGGGANGDGSFRPWFDYVEGYNGYLFCPSLSNINIFNVGASVKPYENTTLALQLYYYMKTDKDSPAGSNGNVDFGGIGATAGAKTDLGWELDGIVGYDYSKDVRVQLVYGAFIPGSAYSSAAGSSVEFRAAAEEVRGELDVKF